MTHTAPGGAVATASPQAKPDTLKIIYLALAHKAIVDEAVAFDKSLDKAEALLETGGVSRKTRRLAENFVRAHGIYTQKLSTEVRRCTDSSDAETRWVGWKLGPLLARRDQDRGAVAQRITGEFYIQSKDPSSDRFFDDRAKAYEAFTSSLKGETSSSRTAQGQGEGRRGLLSNLLSFART